MTEEEFLEQVETARLRLIMNEYYLRTCYVINEFFGIDAYKCYRVFINKFLNNIDGIHIKYYDKSSYPMLLRCMLTEAFLEECLESGKYKEF